MYRQRLFAENAFWIAILLAAGGGPFVALLADDASEVSRAAASLSFESDVAPLLKTYCWKCHGGEARIADLDLRSLALLLRGGKSGPAIVRGSADKSLLYQQLARHKMPPGDELKPTASHVAVIREWLDRGAPARFDASVDNVTDSERGPPISERSWAFRPPVFSVPPRVEASGRVGNAIDAFVLARLEKSGLDLADVAPRTQLVRRAYLDSLGLPPSPEEVDAFLAEDSPLAYSRLVDRLITSPHFGERAGRLWLDAAGYVDTAGSDNDAAIVKAREGIWRYRDWVVRAVNSDMPYDAFITWQLAGDELVDWRNSVRYTAEIVDALTATGFLRLAADTTDESELNTADIRHQVLYDTVQAVSINLLGMTLHCAQCHDHKFDPLTQRDYYRVAAVFASGYQVQAWKNPAQRFLVDVSAADKAAIDAANARLDEKIQEREREIAGLRQVVECRLSEEKFAAIPVEIRHDVKEALAVAADRRSDVHKFLAEKLGPRVQVSAEEIEKGLDEHEQARMAELQGEISSARARKVSYGTIQALWDVMPPAPTYVYRRGDYHQPGERVQPGAIACLHPPEETPSFELSDEGASSGARTAFARWLTRAGHPLTARVIANRVWQQYFGKGLVESSENFGDSGSGPSHEELLDYLAVQLVDHGWSMKWLHREILMSQTYRQAARRDDMMESRGKLADPANRLLWKMPLKRLESEQLRDRVLATSGKLNRQMGGPAVPIKSNDNGTVEINLALLKSRSDACRRSLYVLARRNYQLSELSVFDQPSMAPNCTRRTSSAVVLQSLAMLNGSFSFEHAEHFAKRVRDAAGQDSLQRIDLAFRIALGRPPAEEEVAAAVELLERHRDRILQAKDVDDQAVADAALSQLCLMLLNTNEFLYVD